jgi:hypothetical protein
MAQAAVVEGGGRGKRNKRSSSNGNGNGNGRRNDNNRDRGQDGKFKKGETADCFFTFISHKQFADSRAQLYVVDKVVRWYEDFDVMFDLSRPGNRLERLSRSADDAKVPIELSNALKTLLNQQQRIKMYHVKAVEELNRLKDLVNREGEHEFFMKDGSREPISDYDSLPELFRSGRLLFGNHDLLGFCKTHDTDLYMIAKAMLRRSPSTAAAAAPSTTKKAGLEKTLRELWYHKDSATFYALYEPDRVVKFRIGQAGDIQASEVLAKDAFENDVRHTTVPVISGTLEEMRNILFQGKETRKGTRKGTGKVTGKVTRKGTSLGTLMGTSGVTTL